MKDNYGYVKLRNTLQIIFERLMEEKKFELAEEIKRALKFYGGSPSEFLGESGLALKKILVYKNELPQSVVAPAEEMYQQIVVGFMQVGQKFG